MLLLDLRWGAGGGRDRGKQLYSRQGGGWEDAKMGVGECGNLVITGPFLDSGSLLRCGQNGEFSCRVNNYRISNFKQNKY